MLTIEQARQLVAGVLETEGVDIEGGLALVEDATIAKPYGWVFFYNSRRYLATMNHMDMLIGHGPIVVLAASGEVIELGGGAGGSESKINRFEQERGL